MIVGNTWNAKITPSPLVPPLGAPSWPNRKLEPTNAWLSTPCTPDAAKVSTPCPCGTLSSSAAINHCRPTPHSTSLSCTALRFLLSA